ncbi:MAG: hypothetical protein ABWZ98_07020, partial [Nakamurella sp.]
PPRSSKMSALLPGRPAAAGRVGDLAWGASRLSEVDRSSDDLAAAGASLVGSGLPGRVGAAGGRALVDRGGAAGAADDLSGAACALARPATKSAIGELADRTGRDRRRRNGRSVRFAARSGAE